MTPVCAVTSGAVRSFAVLVPAVCAVNDALEGKSPPCVIEPRLLGVTVQTMSDADASVTFGVTEATPPGSRFKLAGARLIVGAFGFDTGSAGRISIADRIPNRLTLFVAISIFPCVTVTG